MNAADYLENVAVPNVRDFLADPTSLRKAFNAAITLYHFVDYASPSDTKAGEVRQDELKIQCRKEFYEFSVLEDVANAGKHSRRRSGTNASDINVGAAAAFDDGAYFDDGTSWADSPSIVRLEIGTIPADLGHVFEAGVAYFRELVSHGFGHQPDPRSTT